MSSAYYFPTGHQRARQVAMQDAAVERNKRDLARLMQWDAICSAALQQCDAISQPLEHPSRPKWSPEDDGLEALKGIIMGVRAEARRIEDELACRTPLQLDDDEPF